MVLTVKSKGRPGLKNFVMSLKDMTNGDSTILIPLFSASTKSLPVQEETSSGECWVFFVCFFFTFFALEGY